MEENSVVGKSIVGGSKEDERILEDPITLEIMEEAVITSCGHSFSNSTIKEHLEQGNYYCPLCKKELKESDVKPNYALRDIISLYKLRIDQNSLSSSSISPDKQNEEKLIKINVVSLPKQISEYILKELPVKSLDEGSQVLVEAFFNDPWIEYFLPDLKSRREALHFFMRIVVEYGVNHGRVWGAFDSQSNKLKGLAILQPPYESGISTWNLLKLGMGSAPFKFGFTASWRMYSCLQQSEKTHASVIQTPHWALYTIGVDTPFQCKGIGTILVQAILPIVDAESLPCYLDTASERSLKFFQKFGWKIAKEEKKPSCGPKYWALLREPQNKKE